MKIASIASTANLAPAPIDQNTGTAVQNFSNVRALKMRTNYNPGAYDAPETENLLADPPISNDRAQAVEETQPLSPQFAALAKQRRALQAKERALLEKEKALSSQPGQADSIAIARLKSEPLNVLLEAGVTYEELTQAILNNQQNSEVLALRKDFDSYKEQIHKELTEKEQAAEQQALREMENEARSLVNNSSDFELIRTMGHLPDVRGLIERIYREEGNLIDVHEACQMIEEKLFEDIQRVVGLEKVRAQVNPQQMGAQMQKHQGMRTLTNRDTATVPLTAKQRAIAAFNGTLKR